MFEFGKSEKGRGRQKEKEHTENVSDGETSSAWKEIHMWASLNFSVELQPSSHLQ